MSSCEWLVPHWVTCGQSPVVAQILAAKNVERFQAEVVKAFLSFEYNSRVPAAGQLPGDYDLVKMCHAVYMFKV